MKIKNSQFIKAISVEKSILKELTFTDFEKCMLVINNTSTVEEKTSYRSINQKVVTVKNKITMNNGDDKEMKDKQKITTYPYRLNVKFIKHFKNQKITKEIGN